MSTTTPKPRNTVDHGLLLMRIMLGAVFLFHGSQKLFGMFGGPGIENFAKMLTDMGIPQPEMAAYAAAIAEFGGGACILLGLLTRVAAIPVIITMLVAFIVYHKAKFGGPEGGEYALTLAVMLISLALMGAGRFSIDGMFRKASGD